jgi:hypothetical protein
MTLSTVTVQTTPESRPSTPSWMGEIAAFAQVLSQTGILTAVQGRVRFARARMGTYELIDFVVVLIGYALSAEPTLRAFYDRLLPFSAAQVPSTPSMIRLYVKDTHTCAAPDEFLRKRFMVARQFLVK